MVRTLSLTAATFALALGALAQEAAAPAHPLTPFYGTWVGTASGFDEARQPYTVTQTERVGLMLDGAIAVIEGRGYRDEAHWPSTPSLSCPVPKTPRPAT